MRLLLLVTAMLAFAAAPLLAQPPAATLKKITASGKFRIGYRTSLPPMSFQDQNGQPQGYSLDICRKVAEQVRKAAGGKIAVDYVPVTAENRFDALLSGKIDLLCGSTTVTLKRREIVDFSQLTFVTGAALMTRTDNYDNNFNGKKIGVVPGTTTAAELKKMLKETGVKAEVVEVKTAELGRDMLLKHQLDAFAADQVVLIGLLMTSAQGKSLSVDSNSFSFEPLALAMRRNDADFRLLVDREISRLYRSGEVLDIYQKWLGRFSRKRPIMFDALYKLNATPE